LLPTLRCDVELAYDTKHTNCGSLVWVAKNDEVVLGPAANKTDLNAFGSCEPTN
jgi:hypothetical protein